MITHVFLIAICTVFDKRKFIEVLYCRREICSSCEQKNKNVKWLMLAAPSCHVAVIGVERHSTIAYVSSTHAKCRSTLCIASSTNAESRTFVIMYFVPRLPWQTFGHKHRITEFAHSLIKSWDLWIAYLLLWSLAYVRFTNANVSSTFDN